MADKVADTGARMGEQVADDLRDATGSGARKVREMASEYGSRAKEYARQGYEYAADKTGKAKETAQGYIEDYPWYAVGIALGVGVVLGMLLRGGGRDND